MVNRSRRSKVNAFRMLAKSRQAIPKINKTSNETNMNPLYHIFMGEMLKNLLTRIGLYHIMKVSKLKEVYHENYTSGQSSRRWACRL
ncbi:hypothetical protein GCM10011510_03690 [Streptococcus himalayensis]|uniref:Transposase n=1 Tax=Streptococcus himalayensis TaxID=1888195 RepID=A0A917EDQ8_9STRE|nr:hypothetical protein GCM10011510_03690 [Streptococcus himalayensis]